MKNLLVQGYQKPLDKKPFGSRVSKPLDDILSRSSKKEDIKKDEQKKIKILKSFVNGLQKHFSKKQRRENFRKIFGSMRAFGP